MKIPTLKGIIKRRILVNYCAEPLVIQKILPAGFRPKLYQGKAIAGICLIRLEQIRPKHLPEFIGFSSENAAHRIAVEWQENGEMKEGVYVPRRDTDSFINSAVGGRLFPGEHHKAGFDIKENEDEINFAMKSEDGEVSVSFNGKISENLPANSVFSSLAEASKVRSGFRRRKTRGNWTEFFLKSKTGKSRRSNWISFFRVFMKTKPFSRKTR
jgi:hypothetical protein